MKRISLVIAILFSTVAYSQDFTRNNFLYDWLRGAKFSGDVFMPYLADIEEDGDSVVLVSIPVSGRVIGIPLSDLGSQTLSIDGNYLSISDGNGVTLPLGGDVTTSQLGDTVTDLRRRYDTTLFVVETMLTPEMFGAVGDSTTDDTGPVQAWVEACIANKLVGVAAKRYRVTQVNIAFAENLILTGGGTFYKKYGASSLEHIFNITNSTGVEINQLNFVGTSGIDTVFSLTSRLGGINVTTSSFIKIQNCSFKKFISWGIYAKNMNGGTYTEGMIIDNCVFTDFPLDAATSFQCGITIHEDAEYSTIRNCRFFRIPSAVRFDDGANSIFDNNVVMQLNGQYNTTTAALFQDFRSNSGKLQITNNKFNHIETGQRIIYLKNDPVKTGNGYIIAENELLLVGNSTNCYPIYLENAPNSLISGNRIRPASTVNPSALITLFRSDNSIIVNNYLQGGFYSIQISDGTVNIGHNIYNAPAAAKFNYVGTGAAFAINTTLDVTLGGRISDGSGFGTSSQVLLGGSNPAWGSLLPSYLGQESATTGQVLKWNGSAWAPATDNTSAGGGGLNSINAGTGLTKVNDSTLALSDVAEKVNVGDTANMLSTYARKSDLNDVSSFKSCYKKVTSNFTVSATDTSCNIQNVSNSEIAVTFNTISAPNGSVINFWNNGDEGSFRLLKGTSNLKIGGQNVTSDTVLATASVMYANDTFYVANGATISGGGSTDLSGYYTKSEVDSLVSDTLQYYQLKPTVIAVSSNRNIAASDVGNTLSCTSTATLTITLNFSAMAVGDVINLEALGTTFTIEGATGVSINGVSAGDKDVGNSSVYTGGILRKTGTNSYVVL